MGGYGAGARVGEEARREGLIKAKSRPNVWDRDPGLLRAFN